MSKYVVRSGVMRSLCVFAPSRGENYLRGARVIVRTDRGLELGEVLCEATDEAVEGMADPRRGQIVRAATTDDHRELEQLREQERKEFDIVAGCVAKSGLSMKLVDVEHIFGGERIVVYYLSETRVDFRDLVKIL